MVNVFEGERCGEGEVEDLGTKLGFCGFGFAEKRSLGRERGLVKKWRSEERKGKNRSESV